MIFFYILSCEFLHLSGLHSSLAQPQVSFLWLQCFKLTSLPLHTWKTDVWVNYDLVCFFGPSKGQGQRIHYVNPGNTYLRVQIFFCAHMHLSKQRFGMQQVASSQITFFGSSSLLLSGTRWGELRLWNSMSCPKGLWVPFNLSHSMTLSHGALHFPLRCTSATKQHWEIRVGWFKAKQWQHGVTNGMMHSENAGFNSASLLYLVHKR